MEPTPRERRHQARLPKVFLCWFDSGYRDVEARVENVSPNGEGLFVRTAEPPPDEKIVLLIQGSRRQTIQVRGTVRWSSEEAGAEGFGVQIENAAELRAFLERCQIVGIDPGA